MFDYNVNPGLINYGILIRGYSPNSDNLLLKWYPPQFNSCLGFINPGLTLPMVSHGEDLVQLGPIRNWVGSSWIIMDPMVHLLQPLVSFFEILSFTDFATWTRHLRRFAVLLHLIMHRLSTGFNHPRWCRISQPSTVSFLTKVLETDDLWQTHGHKQPAFADLHPHVAGVFLVYTAVGNWLVRWLYHWKHCIWPHGDTLHSFSQKTTRSKRSPLSFYSRFILIGWEPGFVKMDYEQ